MSLYNVLMEKYMTKKLELNRDNNQAMVMVKYHKPTKRAGDDDIEGKQD